MAGQLARHGALAQPRLGNPRPLPHPRRSPSSLPLQHRLHCQLPQYHLHMQQQQAQLAHAQQMLMLMRWAAGGCGACARAAALSMPALQRPCALF